MFDSIDMMFQMLIDMYSGYIRRVEDDTNAVIILMELRQEYQNYQKDNTLEGKPVFTELVNQIDEIIQTKCKGVRRKYNDFEKKIPT